MKSCPRFLSEKFLPFIGVSRVENTYLCAEMRKKLWSSLKR